MALPAVIQPVIRRHSVTTLSRSGQSSYRSLSEAKLPRKKSITSVATTKKEFPGPGACLEPPLLRRHRSTVLCGPMRRASQADTVMDLRKGQLSAEMRVPDSDLRKAHVSAEVRKPEKRGLLSVSSTKTEESENMLRWAMKSKEIRVLQNCVDRAEAHLVRSDLIADAKTLVATIKSEEFLLAAARRGSIAKLEPALKAAMELDVDPESDAVMEAKRSLRQMEVSQALSTTKDEQLLKQAKQALGQIEASHTLSTAMASRDEQQLKQAIEQACTVGVVKAKLDKAENTLSRLMALTRLMACRSHTLLRSVQRPMDSLDARIDAH